MLHSCCPFHPVCGRLPAGLLLETAAADLRVVPRSWGSGGGNRTRAICCLHCPRIAMVGRGSRVSKDQNWDGGRGVGGCLDLTLCMSVGERIKLPALWTEVTQVGPTGRAGRGGEGQGWTMLYWS